MAGFFDILQSAAPIAGAGIGFAFGGAPGMMMGAGIGQMASGGIGLLQDAPEFPGATPVQQQLLNMQMRNIERAQAQQGLSAQQVQNINQSTAFSARQQQQQIANIGQANMSPIDRQNMIRGVLNMIGQQGQSARNSIMEGDIRAEAARIASMGQQTMIASQQAEAVAQAEARRRQAQLNYEQAKMNTFTQNTMAAANAIGAGIEYMDKKQTITNNLKSAGSTGAMMTGEVNSRGDVVGDTQNYDIRSFGNNIGRTNQYINPQTMDIRAGTFGQPSNIDPYGMSDQYFDYDYLMSIGDIM